MLCKKSYRVGDAKSLERLSLLKKGMLMNYQHHWILDNMPITWCYPVRYWGWYRYSRNTDIGY